MKYLRGWVLASVGLLIFALDFFSKSYVHQTLPPMGYFYPYGGIDLFQDWMGIEFSIVHVINKGAAWGVLAGMQEGLLYLRLLIIGSMLVYLLFFNRDRARQWPFVLILAGALGNVADYFRFGHVIDMFHFKFWGYTYPIFNIADSAIFCGIAWLLLQSFYRKKHDDPRKA